MSGSNWSSRASYMCSPGAESLGAATVQIHDLAQPGREVAIVALGACLVPLLER